MMHGKLERMAANAGRTSRHFAQAVFAFVAYLNAGITSSPKSLTELSMISGGIAPI
jgi:hypothetical protein